MRIPAQSMIFGGLLFAMLSRVQGSDTLSPADLPIEAKVVGGTQVTHQTNSKTPIASATVIRTNYGSVISVAWSSDNQYFAILQATGTSISVVVYSASTHEIIKELALKKSGHYSGDQEPLYQGSVAFSPDGRYLAAGAGIVTLWNTKTWDPIRDILGPFSRGAHAAGAVKNVAFSPDGKAIAATYDAVIWPESLKVDSHEDAAAVAELRKTDKSIQNAAAIMAFDIETTKRLFVYKEEPYQNKSVLFSAGLTYSPDGRYLISSRREGIIGSAITSDDDPTKQFNYLTYLDSANGRVVKSIPEVHVMAVTALAVSHNGRLIASGTSTTDKDAIVNLRSNKWYAIENRDPIRLWDMTGGKQMVEMGPIRGGVKGLLFTPDDKILISCQTDKNDKETVWLWNAENGQLIDRVKTPRSGLDVKTCAMSPDGHTIAVPVANDIYLIEITSRHSRSVQTVHYEMSF
jgi:WD40 repeat protein